jgi:hypothetical protein
METTTALSRGFVCVALAFASWACGGGDTTGTDASTDATAEGGQTDSGGGDGGGACTYDPSMLTCPNTFDGGLQVLCDTSSCCSCVDNNTVVKTCVATSPPCGGNVSCCGATNCCGFQ